MVHFTEEVIDVLVRMKGKLIKEERRHLGNAKREKQVKEHVIWQVQILSLTCSLFSAVQARFYKA